MLPHGAVGARRASIHSVEDPVGGLENAGPYAVEADAPVACRPWLSEPRIAVLARLNASVTALEGVELEVDVVCGEVRESRGTDDHDVVGARGKAHVLGVPESEEAQLDADDVPNLAGTQVETGNIVGGERHAGIDSTLARLPWTNTCSQTTLV